MDGDPTADLSPPSPAAPAEHGGAGAPAGTAGIHLEVISGLAVGGCIVVEDELLIGRHASGAGKLANDQEISREHARIVGEADGQYAIEDLGSSNGTFVNGLKLTSPRLLSVGDSIEVGGTTLLVGAIVERSLSEADLVPAADEPTSEAPTPLPDEGQPAPTSAALAVGLEIDFEAREARIALPGGTGTVLLMFEDGRWQAKLLPS